MQDLKRLIRGISPRETIQHLFINAPNAGFHAEYLPQSGIELRPILLDNASEVLFYLIRNFVGENSMPGQEILSEFNRRVELLESSRDGLDKRMATLKPPIYLRDEVVNTKSQEELETNL